MTGGEPRAPVHIHTNKTLPQPPAPIDSIPSVGAVFSALSLPAGGGVFEGLPEQQQQHGSRKGGPMARVLGAGGGGRGAVGGDGSFLSAEWSEPPSSPRSQHTDSASASRLSPPKNLTHLAYRNVQAVSVVSAGSNLVAASGGVGADGEEGGGGGLSLHLPPGISHAPPMLLQPQVVLPSAGNLNNKYGGAKLNAAALETGDSPAAAGGIFRDHSAGATPMHGAAGDAGLLAPPPLATSLVHQEMKMPTQKREGGSNQKQKMQLNLLSTHHQDDPGKGVHPVAAMSSPLKEKRALGALGGLVSPSPPGLCLSPHAAAAAAAAESDTTASTGDRQRVAVSLQQQQQRLDILGANPSQIQTASDSLSPSPSSCHPPFPFLYPPAVDKQPTRSPRLLAGCVPSQSQQSDEDSSSSSTCGLTTMTPTASVHRQGRGHVFESEGPLQTSPRKITTTHPHLGGCPSSPSDRDRDRDRLSPQLQEIQAGERTASANLTRSPQPRHFLQSPSLPLFPPNIQDLHHQISQQQQQQASPSSKPVMNLPSHMHHFQQTETGSRIEEEMEAAKFTNNPNYSNTSSTQFFPPAHSPPPFQAVHQNLSSSPHPMTTPQGPHQHLLAGAPAQAEAEAILRRQQELVQAVELLRNILHSSTRRRTNTTPCSPAGAGGHSHEKGAGGGGGGSPSSPSRSTSPPLLPSPSNADLERERNSALAMAQLLVTLKNNNNPHPSSFRGGPSDHSSASSSHSPSSSLSPLFAPSAPSQSHPLPRERECRPPNSNSNGVVMPSPSHTAAGTHAQDAATRLLLRGCALGSPPPGVSSSEGSAGLHSGGGGVTLREGSEGLVAAVLSSLQQQSQQQAPASSPSPTHTQPHGSGIMSSCASVATGEALGMGALQQQQEGGHSGANRGRAVLDLLGHLLDHVAQQQQQQHQGERGQTD
eukprot:Cvel_1393.t2-p1 / transcript=Cvel_1393.t2 / gene=Cvel_1393 / organism=Chromera_velia_CCMP2878 / gene_product=Carbon catabolite repressor protein 4 homolog 1, putative / transcript_product=Carbon catabolite repressor protein 4 homolog 1, putative / location=Cvel_scaffold48:107959-110745(-) / protein_length=929 / sequence_SO=supercontig / SO=protein_coding / is_pseudo=false